uniref:DALR anticodon-binding domain-containing protein 3 n=1 Tax=Cacopsylla melanoneura TaxID=428564 RepID=A0A8D8T0K2_9HEMI
MEDHLIFQFIGCLYDYFGIPKESLLDHKYIYFEKEKFRQKGDISILKRPLSIKTEISDLVIKDSQEKWCFPLKSINISADYVHLFLNKSIVFKETIWQVHQKGKMYGFHKTNKKISLQKDPNVKNSLTQLRIDLAINLTERLLQKLDYKVTTDDNEINFYFTNRSEIPTGFQKIFIMGVEDGKKKCELSSEDYFSLISSEVSTMSNRMDTPTSTKNLIDTCVMFNLFHANVSSPARLSGRGEVSHNTKDAIFVVYNYVRLKTIVKTYQSKVEQNVYPPLPSIELTDYSLLSKDEEWGILLDHIVRFPQLVAEFSSKLETESKLHLHTLFTMLVVFSNQVSRYYRRVRILTEPKPHLIQIMFARLHLISACLTIYEILFECLNIIPPDSM